LRNCCTSAPICAFCRLDKAIPCIGPRQRHTPLTSAPVAAPLSAASGSNRYAAGVKNTSDFRDLGRAPGSLQVRLTLTLRYQHQEELDALVRAQSSPGSPSFRHYLTNAQFSAHFAPSIESQRRVTEVLTVAGLTTLRTFANRTIVEAGGRSAAVERLFETEIDTGIQAGHGRRYKNVRDAVMPAALRDLVVAVSGLDNLVSFTPRYRVASSLPDVPRAIGGPLRGPNGALGPLGFAQGYDEPVQHGYDGTGRAIANVMAGDIDNDDLHRYLNYFGIRTAHQLRRVAVDGGHFGHNDVETTLDVEAMTGTTPGAQVYLYSFPDFTDAYAEDAYNTIVDDNVVDAANSSWGGCESDRRRPLGHAFALASNLIFEQGAAKGITFPIATGDGGWQTCRHDGTIDETTADSDPYALAVGGTTLNVDGNGKSTNSRCATSWEPDATFRTWRLTPIHTRGSPSAGITSGSARVALLLVVPCGSRSKGRSTSTSAVASVSSIRNSTRSKKARHIRWYFTIS
jgi:subtilase family serine protease